MMLRNTVQQLLPAIGEQITIRMQDLYVACLVLDAKNSYGQVRLLVRPVAGDGQQWVELSRLVKPALEVRS